MEEKTTIQWNTTPVEQCDRYQAVTKLLHDYIIQALQNRSVPVRNRRFCNILLCSIQLAFWALDLKRQ